MSRFCCARRERLWGGSQIEADAELAQHVEGVEVGDVELTADVGYKHSCLCFRIEFFLRHHDGAVGLAVGNKPSVRYRCKLAFCSGSELRIVLNPVND